MPSIKELFKFFVFGYIAAGHTQTEESEAELKQWIVSIITLCNFFITIVPINHLMSNNSLASFYSSKVPGYF